MGILATDNNRIKIEIILDCISNGYNIDS